MGRSTGLDLTLEAWAFHLGAYGGPRNNLKIYLDTGCGALYPSRMTNLREYLNKYGAEYKGRFKALEGAGTPWQKRLFALLTVSTAWKASVDLYDLLAPVPTSTLDGATAFGALRAAGVAYPGARARFIARNAETAHLSPTASDLKGLGPREGLEFIRARCPGLGNAKAAFLWALLDPRGAPVGCLDSHILRGLYSAPRGEVKRLSRKASASYPFYLEGLGRLGAWARALGLAPFETQWVLWDFWRSNSRGEVPTPSALDTVFTR